MVFFRLPEQAVLINIFILFLMFQLSACSNESDLSSTKNADALTEQRNAGEVVVPRAAVLAGTNAAVISGLDTGILYEDNDAYFTNILLAVGKLEIVDNDPGEAGFIAATVFGNYGRLAIDTSGRWYYASRNNQSVIQSLASGAGLQETLVVSSIDGTTHDIGIYIAGLNDVALITGFDTGTVTEDNDLYFTNVLLTVGKLDIVDNDTNESVFTAGVYYGNHGAIAIAENGHWYYAVNNTLQVIQSLATGEFLTDSLTVSSIDGTQHTVEINIVGLDEIVVNPSISLSWLTPISREDGQVLSSRGIAGYRIYYGTTQGQYNTTIDINDRRAQSYTILNLKAGSTYYFVITSYDTQGRESVYSGEIAVSL